jgi:hypothetical protein
MESGKDGDMKGWLTRVSPPTRVLLGCCLSALGASQLLVVVFASGGHVVNLVAGVGLVGVGALHLVSALIQVRKREARKPTVLQTINAMGNVFCLTWPNASGLTSGTQLHPAHIPRSLRDGGADCQSVPPAALGAMLESRRKPGREAVVQGLGHQGSAALCAYGRVARRCQKCRS